MSSSPKEKQANLEEEDRLREEAKHAKDKKYRYLPRSWRSLDDLKDAVGIEQAMLIQSLIEDMIQEALHPETDY